MRYRKLPYKIQGANSPAELLLLQKQFCVLVNDLIIRGVELIFVDETTCHRWHHAGLRTWHPPNSDLFHELPATRGKGVALMGAISTASQSIVLRTYDRNNSINFLEFLKPVAGMARNARQTVVVMDNATYHRNLKVKDFLNSRGIGLLYLPPSSSELNPIEFIWGHIKRRLQKRLLESRQRILQRDFRPMVVEVAYEYGVFTNGSIIANAVSSKILRPLEGFLV